MENNKIKILKKNFISVLSKYIKKGSVVNCEFDLAKFNTIALVAKNKKKFINFFIEVFLELVGKNGTLIVPGFSYSWGKNRKKKFFNIHKTKPEIGILPNYLLNKSNVVRTRDPMFSFFILGSNKKYFTNIGNNSFGKNSVFHKILKKKGILVSFGLNRFDPTFVHYVEQFFDENYSKLHYRYLKKFSGHIISNKKKSYEDFFTFSKAENSKFVFDGKKIKTKLNRIKKITKLKLMKNDIFIVNSRDFFDIGIKGLKKDRKFFVIKR